MLEHGNRGREERRLVGAREQLALFLIILLADVENDRVADLAALAFGIAAVSLLGLQLGPVHCQHCWTLTLMA